ncbi:MAG TPA: sulfatase [Thermoanaerobaculia bacterium]
MRGRAGRELARAAPGLLALAVGLGAAVGLGRGWRFPGEGFPLLLAEAIRGELLLAFAGAGLFGLLYLPVRAAVAGRLPGRLGIALAAALAGAPLLAAAGYRLNREAGFRPAELLEPYPLRWNLLLVAAGAAVWVAVWWLLARAARSERAPRASLTPVLVLAGAAVLVYAGVGAALASREPAPDRPDVLLLLVDALRPDRLGAYGHGRETSPAIDALAADGILFRDAVAQSTFTKSSVASLLTGRYPYQHGVYWGSRTDDPELPGAVTSDLLPAEERTLAEALRPAGYLTAAWVQNSHLRDFMGFAQGFVEFHDQQGGIERIHRRFLSWLRGAGGRYPYFAYLHYIDLHDPYLPEPPYDELFGRGAGAYEGIDLAEWGAYLEAVREGRETLAPAQVAQLEALYDGQIRYVDDQVGHLLEALRREGRYDDTLIVLTSDHGDAFYEHGFISHSTTPYEELVRVPLVVKLPGNRHAGAEVENQARLVDVMPTVLDLLGLPAPPEVAGCSLRPLWEGGAGPERPPGCGEAVIEIAEEGAYPVVAVRAGGLKYIHHQHAGDELYDLAGDPGETRNLVGAGLPQEEALRQRALEVVAAREALSGESIELDEKTIRELKALGYLD